MEPPSKRQRLDDGASSPFRYSKPQPTRESLAMKLKSRFESIFQKYGKDFSDVADEVDLNTGEIVVDNGHLRSMPDVEGRPAELDGNGQDVGEEPYNEQTARAIEDAVADLENYEQDGAKTFVDPRTLNTSTSMEEYSKNVFPARELDQLWQYPDLPQADPTIPDPKEFRWEADADNASIMSGSPEADLWALNQPGNLGLSNSRRAAWSEAEDALLKELRETRPMRFSSLQEHFPGRSIGAIAARWFIIKPRGPSSSSPFTAMRRYNVSSKGIVRPLASYEMEDSEEDELAWTPTVVRLRQSPVNVTIPPEPVQMNASVSQPVSGSTVLPTTRVATPPVLVLSPKGSPLGEQTKVLDVQRTETYEADIGCDARGSKAMPHWPEVQVLVTPRIPDSFVEGRKKTPEALNDISECSVPAGNEESGSLAPLVDEPTPLLDEADLRCGEDHVDPTVANPDTASEESEIHTLEEQFSPAPLPVQPTLEKTKEPMTPTSLRTKSPEVEGVAKPKQVENKAPEEQLLENNDVNTPQEQTNSHITQNVEASRPKTPEIIEKTSSLPPSTDPSSETSIHQQHLLNRSDEAAIPGHDKPLSPTASEVHSPAAPEATLVYREASQQRKAATEQSPITISSTSVSPQSSRKKPRQRRTIKPRRHQQKPNSKRSTPIVPVASIKSKLKRASSRYSLTSLITAEGGSDDELSSAIPSTPDTRVRSVATLRSSIRKSTELCMNARGCGRAFCLRCIEGEDDI